VYRENYLCSHGSEMNSAVGEDATAVLDDLDKRVRKGASTSPRGSCINFTSSSMIKSTYGKKSTVASSVADLSSVTKRSIKHTEGPILEPRMEFKTYKSTDKAINIYTGRNRRLPHTEHQSSNISVANIISLPDETLATEQPE